MGASVSALLALIVAADQHLFCRKEAYRCASRCVRAVPRVRIRVTCNASDDQVVLDVDRRTLENTSDRFWFLKYLARILLVVSDSLASKPFTN
jgi:hypothetical protein